MPYGQLVVGLFHRALAARSCISAPPESPETHRGRTYRTHRTTRTAADAAHTQRPHPSPRRGAFRSPFSGARQRPLPFVIAAQRETCPNFQAFKLQTSKQRPAGGSRPLIGSNRRNLRFPLRRAFVSLWKTFLAPSAENVLIYQCRHRVHPWVAVCHKNPFPKGASHELNIFGPPPPGRGGGGGGGPRAGGADTPAPGEQEEADGSLPPRDLTGQPDCQTSILATMLPLARMLLMSPSPSTRMFKPEPLPSRAITRSTVMGHSLLMPSPSPRVAR